MPLHKDLTGADLHEPKGAASASLNTSYFADGAGSGVWKKVDASCLDSSLQSPNVVYLNAVLANVSSASSILVPAPEACTFESATFFLGGAITGTNPTITLTRNDGAAIGNFTITTTGSAEGTVQSFTASSNKVLAALGYVKIATSGGSTGAIPLYCQLKFLRTP